MRFRRMGHRNRTSNTDPGLPDEWPTASPFERRIILGVLGLGLVGIPLIVGYARSSTGLNEIACGVLIGGLLWTVRMAERWFAQPTMIIAVWLFLSEFIFPRTDASDFTNILIGSFIVMASTNREPSKTRLRILDGGKRLN